jgi:hypothetical protein
MRITARFLRRATIAVAFFPATAIGGQFCVALAEEHGLFQSPTAKVLAVSGWLETFVSSTPFAWGAGLAFGFAAGVWLDALVRRHEVAGTLPAAIGTDEIGLSINLDYAEIDTRELSRDLLLKVSFRFFNGSGRQLGINELRGCLSYRPFGSSEEPVALPKPALIDNPPLPNFGDGFVQFEQRVPGEIGISMVKALEADGLELDVGGLELIADGVDAPQVKLPLKLWSRLRVYRSSPGIVTGRIVVASLAA